MSELAKAETSRLLPLVPMVFAWGLNYLFVRYGLAYAPALWLALGRSALGAVCVGVLLLVRPQVRARLDAPARRDALLLGLPNTTIFFGLWFVAAASVLPGEAAVLVYTFPLWVTLLSVPVLGHRISWPVAVAIPVGFSGVVLITQPWVGGAGLPPPLAVVELLGGAFAWAFGTVAFQRRFAAAEMQEANLYQLVGGALGLAAACIVIEPVPPPLTYPLLGAVVWLGAVGTGMAYAIWFWLLGQLPAARLSAYVFLVPVVALGFSVLLLGERLGLLQVAGVVVVLASIYAVARGGEPVPSSPATGPRPLKSA